MTNLLLAHDVTNFHGEAAGGFNSRIHGEMSFDGYGLHPTSYAPRYAGWHLADEMVRAGKLFSVQPFPHPPCPDAPFKYGGTWVCNRCGKSRLEKDWWIIKVRQDGNAWCCIGSDFEDLQSSDNYAFGTTRDEAIKNYGYLMLGTAPEDETK